MNKGALDKLAGFASQFGANFYDLPCNMETITLTKNQWNVPKQYSLEAGNTLIPLRAGGQVGWQLSHV